MRIFVNQIGYRPEDRKTAVLNTKDKVDFETFSLVDDISGQTVYEGALKYAGKVARWNRCLLYTSEIADAKKWMDKGVDFIDYSTDTVMFMEKCKETVQALHS